jgi:hypothetical protein
MIDRLFILVLMLSALVGGTLAVGAELFARPVPQAHIAELPRVVVTGSRQPASVALAVADAPRAAE